MKDFFRFLLSKAFWTHLGLIVLTGLLLLFLINIWLKQYTKHGQKLALPDFVGQQMEEATSIAREASFELIITDSVHIVGQHGSTILKQNPTAGFHVKEGRKVYVTVTKHNPDMIKIDALPALYGENYERKKKELEVGFELNSEVVGSIYDIGPEGHIMKVIFEKDTIIRRRYRQQNLEIPRGATLQFILSSSSGGRVDIPNLVCQTYDAAKFLLNGYNLSVGNASADASVENYSEAFVFKQEPAYEEGKKIEMGTAFILYLSKDRPDNCQ